MAPENERNLTDILTERRTVDPIEGLNPVMRHPIGRLALQEMAVIDKTLQEDDTLTGSDSEWLYRQGCDARLDSMYVATAAGTLSQTQFSRIWDKANGFFKKALADAKEQGAQDYLWDIAIKRLDLWSLQAYRNAHDAETTLQGTSDGTKAWALAESQVQGVLADSVRIMRGMLRHAHGDDERSSRTRGTLFELLVVSYARLKTYEDETFGQTFVRTALDREDRPYNRHVVPKRAFDIAIEQQGKMPRLLQLKTSMHDESAYAEPIEKIQSANFHELMNNLPRYVRDFSLVLENPSDPSKRADLNAAYDRLDQAFGSQLVFS